MHILGMELRDLSQLVIYAWLTVIGALPMARKLLRKLRPIGELARDIIVRDILRRVDELEERVETVEIVTGIRKLDD